MLKKLVLGLGFIIITLLLGIFLIFSLTDFNRLKPSLQKKIYDTFALEIKVNGDIKASLSPFGYKIEDVVVLDKNTTKIKIKSIDMLLDKSSMLLGKADTKELIFNDMEAFADKSDIIYLLNNKNISFPSITIINSTINYDNKSVDINQAKLSNLKIENTKVFGSSQFSLKKIVYDTDRLEDINATIVFNGDVLKFDRLAYKQNNQSFEKKEEFTLNELLK